MEVKGLEATAVVVRADLRRSEWSGRKHEGGDAPVGIESSCNVSFESCLFFFLDNL